ncbi:MAG: ABC transporter permease [Acidobacteriota bacterium]
MIGTLLKISFTNLRRDRVAQAMTFLLPILFFSIFANVFGAQRDPTRKVNVAVADEDQSVFSKKIVNALAAEGGLAVRRTTGKDGAGDVLTRASAEKLVRDGALSVAVVLPKGLGENAQLWGGGTSGPKVQILADVSDPIAPQLVQGLLQKVSFTAAPDRMADQGVQMFTQYAGGLTPQQQTSLDQWKATLNRQEAIGDAATSGPAPAASNIGLQTELVNVLQPSPAGGDTSLISFYAAGVGVMFLLFSCSSGAGTMLDEEESGTLGRLLSSRAGMRGVLLGKWVFLWMMGAMQLTVMFLWGAVVFGLPLSEHLAGFAVMTLVTAGAAAAFGMVLATACRTRQQLGGISTIVILTMSALGGSMFPRFLMSETMQKMGLVTFNAWALDGYIKVFWRNATVVELWPQVGVLAALTAVFMTLARMFARRWETL